jgi:membrane protease YdiL (CAAX protease family)
VLIYLVAGSGLYWVAFSVANTSLGRITLFPRSLFTIVPGLLMLAMCWVYTRWRPLAFSTAGRGEKWVMAGLLGIVALFGCFFPRQGFGENIGPSVALGLVVVVPFAEEIYFRGILFDHFRRTLGALPALLLSTLLFGGLHHDQGYVVSMIVLGLLAGGAVLATKSVASAVAVHLAWNACAVMETARPLSRGLVFLVALGALVWLFRNGLKSKVSNESVATEAVGPSA